MHIHHKRVIAATIATLLATAAGATAVSATEHAKPQTGVQAGSDALKKSDTERSSGTGTSQSGSAYGSSTTTSSGATGTGTGTASGATDSVRSTDSATGRTTADTTSMGSGAASRMAANPLYGRSADKLKGTDVVDSTGDKIGDIKAIVLSQDRRSAHAVIGVGGFLGIGEHDIAVSLEELRVHDGDELQISATKEQLKARPEYQSAQFSELQGDQAISGSITDFAAFETDRGSSTGTGTGMGRDSSTGMGRGSSSPSTGTGASGASGSSGTGTTGSGATGSGSTVR